MFRVRAHQRMFATVALAACLSSVVLPGLEAHPAGSADDAACRLLSSPSENGGPRMAAPGALEHAADHCVVCHLQRAHRGAFASEVTTLTLPIAAETLPGLIRIVASAVVIATPTSRGPPSFLYS